jgi:soluble lytic murein transglycosylase-like protein
VTRLSLTAVWLALTVLVPASAYAEPPRSEPVLRWGAEIDVAATRCGVPVAWIERVMRAESGGQTMLNGRPIVSHAGAMGLMQLMPATWAEMRSTLALGADPHDPADNIVAGACYLRLMYDRFGYPGLFGAYNAGPGRYAAWLAGRGALPGETRAYLTSVAGQGDGRLARVAVPAVPVAPPIFVTLRSVATTPAPARVVEPGDARAALFLIDR